MIYIFLNVSTFKHVENGRDTNLQRAENPSWFFAKSGEDAERLVQERRPEVADDQEVCNAFFQGNGINRKTHLCTPLKAM